MKERKKPYKIKTDWVDVGGDRKMKMKYAASKDGTYIGSPQEAYNLWRKFGIEVFEPRKKGSRTCTVGFSPKDGKWYGWSHRAIKGFKDREAAAKFAESVS